MAAAARVGAYAARGDADSLEALTKKLAADMRDNLRELELVPVLSTRWNELTDKLFRVANISEMEKRIPKAKADSTLWEGEELVLRYMLEDGKLNLCVRMLDEYLAYRTAPEAASRVSTSDELCKFARFEFGVGQLVANALLHREVFQTTNLPLLCQVLAGSLKLALAGTATPAAAAAALAAAPLPAPAEGAAATPPQLPPRGLEGVALHVIAALGKAATGSAERKVINELIKAEVFDLVLRHLAAHSKTLDAADVMLALDGLTALVATEEFALQKVRATPTPESVDAGASLRELILDPLIEDLAVRKKLRPFLDFVSDLQRKAKK